VSRIAGPLFEAAKLIRASRPQTRFIIPAINAARRADIEGHLATASLDAQVFDNSLGAGVGRLVMGAADTVVLASGTATLEAMLMKKPMVVAYRLHWLTFLIARLLVKSRFVTLPNLLAGEELVPELIQHEAAPERIAAETLRWLNDRDYRESRLRHFRGLHESLRQNADVKAADAVARLLQSRVGKS
jgi:lipid-A-disaccharide synthase